MTNNKLRNEIEKQIDQTYSDLQDLRDGVNSSQSMLIIDDMLTQVRSLQEKCFLLSNQEDVYKG